MMPVAALPFGESENSDSARRVEVAILGAGLAGLTAANCLRGQDVEVLEAATYVGGRTKSARFGNSAWANFGAQYVTDDKVKVVELADEVGATLVPAPFDESGITDHLDGDLRKEVRLQIERVDAEQARPRPPTAWELDDQSFASWLGPCSDAAASFWDHWAGGMLCCSITEVSLYGVLWWWGNQRTSPWSDQPVESSGRGATVLAGGTNELTIELAQRSGARVSLRTQVDAVIPTGGEYVIRARCEGEAVTLRARHVICALPAPVAASVCKELPGWKQQALGSVRYGRFLATPMLVAPVDRQVGPWRFSVSRPNQVYNANDFRLRTPGDAEQSGVCYHSYVYDRFARQIWDDPDDSITSGAVRALLAEFPEYADRVEWVGIQRWKYGLPQYSLGHMKRLDALRAPVGSLRFCGDYCSPSNMEGAARNGERAAAEVKAEMEVHS